ncbi:uncharacterized protein LOC134189372 [Corticium candelabrum]|uniref:uncharacterized protein LOC134189372 n=1 Tax=Corticium candelabrum TaxID=121492 RepID=UPI002E25D0DC|nr:uncharacterized protein LOC134189372 [Corticium candelabrum]
MESTGKLSELLEQGNTLFNKFYYQEALLLYSEARELSNRIPSSTAERADIEHNVGYSYLQLGRYERAEEALREALEFGRKRVDSGAEIAITLTALGQCLRLQGKHAACEAVLQEALDIEKKLPRDQPTTAWTLMQMGRCLVDQQRNLEAKTFLQRAFKINKAALGLTHRHTADTLYMLGVCMGELGLWESGYRELSEALTARKIAYGDGHINVAWVLFWRGAFLNRLSNVDEAECELRKAEDIARHYKLSPSHPLCTKIEHELQKAAELRSLKRQTEKQHARISEDHKAKSATPVAVSTFTPRAFSLIRRKESPRKTNGTNEQKTEITTFQSSDLPVKFKQSPSSSSGGSAASLDTGYVSLSRSQSSLFGSCMSMLGSTWSLQSSGRNCPRSRHSVALDTELISRIGVTREESAAASVVYTGHRTRNQSDPNILKSRRLSFPNASLEPPYNPLLSLTQPDGVYWSGGTLETMMIEKKPKSVLTSHSSVIGPAGGKCGSDSVFLRVSHGAVAMPTKVSIQTYYDLSLYPPPQQNDNHISLSALAHVSLSSSRFKQPIELHLPPAVPLLPSVTSSGWCLQLKMCDASSQSKPTDWYTALEFNTNTQSISTHSQSIAFDPKRSVVRLDRVCWVCWVGRLLGTPSLGLRKVSYALFAKRLEKHRWTVSVHLIHGSNVAYDEIASALKERQYVALQPPIAATVGVQGYICLKLQCVQPWSVTKSAEAHIPMKSVWDVPVNGSLYYTTTVEDCTFSSRHLECTMLSSFKGDWLDAGEPVKCVVFHPVDAGMPQSSAYSNSNVTNFTFSHVTGLAFGATAQLVQQTAHEHSVGQLLPDVTLTRNCEIIPEHIAIDVPVRLAIQLPPSDKQAVPSGDSIVQFIGDQGEMDVVERTSLRLNDRELDVLCPAWPFSGRLLVRVTTATCGEELGIGFVTVGDFSL